MITSPPGDLHPRSVLPDARFRETHRRHIDRPIAEVWPACLAVTGSEIRTLGPLMALRTLPARIRNRDTVEPATDKPLLDTFADEGFVILAKDSEPRGGRARVVFGAAGKFWSPTGNQPIEFDSPAAFLSFVEPGHAVTVASVEAVDNGDGTTTVETETRVDGTDAASTAKFAPYWALIRLPSGLIRRSWLAAIDRRANRTRDLGV